MNIQLLSYLRTNVLAFLLCLVALPACAVNIVVTGSRYESGGTRYNFTVNDWNTSDTSPSWCNESYVPQNALCSLWVVGAPREGSLINAVDSSFRVRDMPMTLTMGDLLKAMIEKGVNIPYNGSILIPHGTRVDSNFCLTFVRTLATPNVGSFVHRFTGPPCTPLPRPPLACQLTGRGNIEHTNLTDVTVEGAQASTRFTLRCNGATQILISAGKENALGVRLRSDNSLYSRLTINDQAAANGVPIRVNANQTTNFDVKSTLVTRGKVAPGNFSGSTVLTVSVP